MTQRNRLETFEATADLSGPICIFKNADETREQAIAKWRRENDGQDPEKPSAKIYLPCWGDGTAEGHLQ